MILHLQPVRVATDSDDCNGQLVFVDGFLVAVLVQLSGQHGAFAGMWFLEAGFGLTAVMSAPPVLGLGCSSRLGRTAPRHNAGQRVGHVARSGFARSAPPPNLITGLRGAFAAQFRSPIECTSARRRCRSSGLLMRL